MTPVFHAVGRQGAGSVIRFREMIELGPDLSFPSRHPVRPSFLSRAMLRPRFAADLAAKAHRGAKSRPGQGDPPRLLL